MNQYYKNYLHNLFNLLFSGILVMICIYNLYQNKNPIFHLILGTFFMITNILSIRIFIKERKMK